MTDPTRWLVERGPAPPDPVRAAVLEGLANLDRPAASLGQRLARAGLDLLRDVIAAPSGRERAMDLLAADALLTYACEAAAEEGPRALEELMQLLQPSRFQALLDREVAE